MSLNQDQAYAAYLASYKDGKYNTRHLRKAKAPEGPEVMQDLNKSDFFDGPPNLGNMGPRQKIPYYFNDPHRKVPEGPQVRRDLNKSDFYKGPYDLDIDLNGSGKIKSRKNKKSRKSRKNNKSRKSRKNNKSRKNKK